MHDLPHIYPHVFSVYFVTYARHMSDMWKSVPLFYPGRVPNVGQVMFTPTSMFITSSSVLPVFFYP